MKTEYNKLVRDNIPEIIISNGNACKYRQANERERLMYLKTKIEEEMNEFLEAYKEDSLSGMQEELVDLLTVTLRYIDEKQDHIPYCEGDKQVDYTIKGFINYYNDKIENKGGFKKGYILLEVEDNE